MFAQIIELKTAESASENELEDKINSFICGLKNNGQILNDYLVIKKPDGYSLYVTTPKSDSLNGCFDSVYVKKFREELEKFFSITVEQIGVNARSQEYCSCTTRTAIEMQTYATDIDSVFTCCTCGKPIALYELPYLDRQDDHWWIVNWQNAYGDMDGLWLDSINDRFTGNQLVNVNSALNKAGIEIADQIKQKTGLKAYYNVFDDLTKKVKFVKVNDKLVRLCPRCGNPMQYVKFGEDYERYVCEDCMLSSDLPKE